jgi:DNA-binding Lrp family transcriptional regulator
MKSEDIAKSMSISQKTVKRRLEMMMIRNHVLHFGIVYNPSAMKGYNTRLIIQTDHIRHYHLLIDTITVNVLNATVSYRTGFIFFVKILVVVLSSP